MSKILFDEQPMVIRIAGAFQIDLNLPGKRPCAYFVITPDTHPAFNFLWKVT